MSHPSYMFATVTCMHCGEQLAVPVYCGNRFCPDCNKSRQMKIRYKLDEFVKTRTVRNGITFKFLTLTIKSQPDLKRMIESISTSYRRLRQRKLWRNKVLGGAFVIEMTFNKSGWHAHIHAIIESYYLPWKSVLADWESITGSTGVMIQMVPVQAITRYLTKYITKTELDEDLQVEASEAIKGKRLFQPFGTWHNGFGAIDTPQAKCNKCDQCCFEFGDVNMIMNNAIIQVDMPGRLLNTANAIKMNLSKQESFPLEVPF